MNKRKMWQTKMFGTQTCDEMNAISYDLRIISMWCVCGIEVFDILFRLGIMLGDVRYGMVFCELF